MMTNNPVKMEWLMEAAIDPKAELSLARMTLAGCATSQLHYHTNCCETLHVISGKIRQRIGHAWREMHAGDTCLIPIKAMHQTQNLQDEDAVMMLAYSAGQREYVQC